MRIVNGVRWGLVALFIVLLAGPAIVVAVGGLTVVEVDGQSMEPTIGLGDVVVIRDPRPSDLVVGAVVTAVDSTGAKYTHRIVGVEDDGDLLLRGDNNSVDDPAPVPTSDIVGVLDGQFTGPAATFVMQLQGWPLRVCLLAMIVGLVFLPLPSMRRPVEEAARPVGRRSRRRAAPALAAPGAPAASSPAAPASPTTSESAIPEAERLEALDLVDGLRNSMARVLLASERRLGGRITVTTHSGEVGPFPSLRVVIDIAEKPASTTAVAPAPAVRDASSTVTRRQLREQTTPRKVVRPVSGPARSAPMDPADAASLLWTRAAGSLPDDLPTRRSHRDAHRHGRRRAR